MNKIQENRFEIFRVLTGTTNKGRGTRNSSQVRKPWKGLLTLTAVCMLACFTFLTTAQAQSSSRFTEKVRHALVTLPYYSVFDNLAFQIQDNGKVVLTGQVTRPTLRRDAENVVKRLEEVDSVDNQIEVLPASTMDDHIRLATYRAIYYDSMFTRYAIRAIPPIHIIVDTGDVTLDGVVATEADRNLANILANGVPGVFSVTNNLVVESEKGVS